jgi:hypothetical protein
MGASISAWRSANRATVRRKFAPIVSSRRAGSAGPRACDSVVARDMVPFRGASKHLPRSYFRQATARLVRVPNGVCVDQLCLLTCPRQVEPIWGWHYERACACTEPRPRVHGRDTHATSRCNANTLIRCGGCAISTAPQPPQHVPRMWRQTGRQYGNRIEDHLLPVV